MRNLSTFKSWCERYVYRYRKNGRIDIIKQTYILKICKINWCLFRCQLNYHFLRKTVLYLPDYINSLSITFTSALITIMIHFYLSWSFINVSISWNLGSMKGVNVSFFFFCPHQYIPSVSPKQYLVSKISVK